MEQAVVLHRWPYQENSWIVELFSQQRGRFRVVARGARRSKSPWRSCLEPFILLEADWGGRGELQTLRKAEPLERLQLTGDHLYSGFYLNELMQRLTPEQAAVQGLLEDYWKTLELLAAHVNLELVLRRFEWLLLERLELDFSWQYEADAGQEITPADWYRFIPEKGFVPVPGLSVQEGRDPLLLTGTDILALGSFQVTEKAQLRQLKTLMRAALSPYLGQRPLHSRALFAQSQELP